MNSNDLANVMGSFIKTELNSFEELNKELEEKDKEIERLNNIIKELENFLKNWCFTSIYRDYVLDKLNELKGDSSNE